MDPCSQGTKYTPWWLTVENRSEQIASSIWGLIAQIHQLFSTTWRLPGQPPPTLFSKAYHWIIKFHPSMCHLRKRTRESRWFSRAAQPLSGGMKQGVDICMPVHSLSRVTKYVHFLCCLYSFLVKETKVSFCLCAPWNSNTLWWNDSQQSL